MYGETFEGIIVIYVLNVYKINSTNELLYLQSLSINYVLNYLVALLMPGEVR